MYHAAYGISIMNIFISKPSMHRCIIEEPQFFVLLENRYLSLSVSKFVPS